MTIHNKIKLNQLSEQHILVVGDFMLDRYLSGSATRISPEAPVPVVSVKKEMLKVGGAGNVALNIVALGSRVRALTTIGDDSFGAILASELYSRGVETDFLFRDSDRRTSLKTRVVAQNQQLLRYDEEAIIPAGETFSNYIIEKKEEIFQDISGVILSDYGKGVLTPEITQLVIRQAKQRNLPVFVDPKGTDYSKYSGADFCTPNLKELGEASGCTDLLEEETICAAALSVGRICSIENLLVTRSEKGMSLVACNTGEKRDYPAVAKEVSDVTGAGDTVIATFCLGVVSGFSMDICCEVANAAASIVVSKFGAATADISEIEAVMYEATRVSRQKVHTQEEIKAIAESLHRNGKKVVFTNGCFDLVHAGHISSFSRAKAFGDVLIVGVNSDASIRRLKGEKRPIVDLKNRLKLLESIELIDYLVPFEEDTPQGLIEAIRPDVLVKGKDWEGKAVAGSDFLKSYGGRLEFIDLERGLSTTAIIEKILRANMTI